MTTRLFNFGIGLVLSLAFAQGSQARDLTFVQGLKFPNTLEEGIEPIPSRALAPRSLSDLKGFNQLLPFVTPSPDQEDANSCMLMSMTGVVEWWLHRLHGVTRFVQNGDLDLSERWWMNMSEDGSKMGKIDNWFTDAIYLFNEAPGVLNRDYPFAKGWYLETEDDIRPARPNSQKAQYGARYNWIDDSDKVRGSAVRIPPMGRRVLLRNKEENPWAIGAAPSDIVEKIIAAFQKYQAPIQVIYNHEGYWHSVYIIGYDAEMSSYNCPFVTDSLNYFMSEAEKMRQEGNATRMKRMLRYHRELTEAMQKVGGCNPKGMFYVRDSQYPDASEEIYIYDPRNPAANKPYSKRIVLREFDWIRTMANHVSVIYPKRNPGQKGR